MYFGYHPYQVRSDVSLVTDIGKAIQGQYNAIYCYEKLAAQAPNDEVKQKILEIRQDEIRHYQTFSEIYTSLTGRPVHVSVTESCPSGYREGLRAAFLDEQKTVDEYLDIADKAQDVSIKEQFKRAASDEQNHAVWFLSFIVNM